MKICKTTDSTDHSTCYSLLNRSITKFKEEKDIHVGVLLYSKLTFENDISEKVYKAISIFAVIMRAFKYILNIF